MWLARPGPVGYQVLLTVEPNGDLWTVRESGVVPRVRTRPSHESSRPSGADLERARGLYSAMRGVSRESSVWMALTALGWGITAELAEIRFLMVWVGLEALFSPSQGRITKQIANRIAFFLEDAAEAREMLRTKVVKAYQAFRRKLR